jgi:alpha-galactosidase
MADVYKLIFDLTRQLRPNSVTQICPCGTPLSLQLIPFTDQTVTADPTSSHQVRQRIKFYKALMGSNAAVFADHVELSDNGTDFASGIGTGGVPSTKFIWPDDESVRARLNEVWDLPDEKKAEWQKWFSIYNEYRLSEGEYLNLYDLAFDYPEGHVIRVSPKSGDFGLQSLETLETKMFYAFYTHSLDESYSGSIELRGLDKSKTYRGLNYVTGQEIAQINGANPVIEVTFKGAFLMKVWED